MAIPGDLLLYKLSKIGINGQYFDVIEDIYNESTAQPKITNTIIKGWLVGHSDSESYRLINIHDKNIIILDTAADLPRNKTFDIHLGSNKGPGSPFTHLFYTHTHTHTQNLFPSTTPYLALPVLLSFTTTEKRRNATLII